MPVMVPVLYAIRMASPKLALVSPSGRRARAAAATRRLPAVASRMPVNPTAAENSAPIRNATPRPIAIVRSSATECMPGSAAHGHLAATITPVSSTMSTPTTVNWRRRYAFAPSRTASATFCMAGVPVSAAYTSFISRAAYTSPPTATTRHPSSPSFSPSP
jgi:hypothetical protein